MQEGLESNEEVPAFVRQIFDSFELQIFHDMADTLDSQFYSFCNIEDIIV